MTSARLRRLIDLLKSAAGPSRSKQQLGQGATIDERLGTRVQLFYETLLPAERQVFFREVSLQLGIDKEDVAAKAGRLHRLHGDLARSGGDELQVHHHAAEELAAACTPRVVDAINTIGLAEGGIKFLVRMRCDLLALTSPSSASAASTPGLRALSGHLLQALSHWFTPGLLSMVKVDWSLSSGEMLERVMQGEQVHPMNGWCDLKRRLDRRDRRVYAFLHPCLGPNDPLVVLHCALSSTSPSDDDLRQSGDRPDEASSVEAIISSRIDEASRSADRTSPPTTAIFYSISSLQPGLKGVNIGHHLILKAAEDIKREIPSINRIMTISPMPSFRPWLLHKLSLESSSLSHSEPALLTSEDQEILSNLVNRPFVPEIEIKGILPHQGNAVRSLYSQSCTSFVELLSHPDLDYELFKPILMRLAARYILEEKRRDAALCSVANFHFSNGAKVSRIVWAGDQSHAATDKSFGMMVNYEYELDKIYDRIRSYTMDRVISI